MPEPENDGPRLVPDDAPKPTLDERWAREESAIAAAIIVSGVTPDWQQRMDDALGLGPLTDDERREQEVAEIERRLMQRDQQECPAPPVPATRKRTGSARPKPLAADQAPTELTETPASHEQPALREQQAAREPAPARAGVARQGRSADRPIPSRQRG